MSENLRCPSLLLFPSCPKSFGYAARIVAVILLYLIISIDVSSQSKLDSVLTKLDPQRFAAVIAKKADRLQEKMLAKAEKTLVKLQKHERKLYKKMLNGKDSLLAYERLKELDDRYNSLKAGLNNPIPAKARLYIPELDSLSTSIKFLDQNQVAGKVKDAIVKTELLQGKFDQAEQIKMFIRERRELLKMHLERLGLVKQLKKINKTYLYYSAQLQEYKTILKDPKKIEKKALQMLSETKMFQDFMKKNSLFASLGPSPIVPGNSNLLQSGFAGLQTRAQLSTAISNQFGGVQTADPGLTSVLMQTIVNARSTVDEVRNGINELIVTEDLEMPDFKYNSQKVRSLKKRLQFGTDFQTQKSNAFFPTTSDISLSLAFLLNDKSSMGIGSSIKVGWGKNIQNIKITGEGLSLRSFIDLKINKSFYASGGFEYNYQQSFYDLRLLYDIKPWKKSGLIGITKIISVKTKFFKKTKLQLLFDYLYRESLPRTQPLKFRVGYIF